MIQGYFASTGVRRRPFVHGSLQLTALNHEPLDVELLVDTAADRTVLSPFDVLRLGVDPSGFPAGAASTGVGGRVETRSVDAVLTLGTLALPLTIVILTPSPTALPIPSLLGRDILGRFALVMEERTERVLLLDPAEADRLVLP